MNPRGPLFRKKKKKSQKGVPWGGVTPPVSGGKTIEFGKKMKITYSDFFFRFGVGVPWVHQRRPPPGRKKSGSAGGVGGSRLIGGADMILCTKVGVSLRACCCCSLP